VRVRLRVKLRVSVRVRERVRVIVGVSNLKFHSKLIYESTINKSIKHN
jgi:hypothetical protein